MIIPDFRCKHHIMIEDEDGTLRPMDEPFFRASEVKEGVWQVLSDGDFTYVVEGDDEALVIDGGYGCGNIREFCQTLTRKPISRIANTHFHFDHTANNYLFDTTLMSQGTYDRRTIPFPSFNGVEFERDYPVEIIGDGTIIHLGNHDLETIALMDHAIGSLAFLDRKNRILFSGDEVIDTFHSCRFTVEHTRKQFAKLMSFRNEYDILCAGGGVRDAELVDRYDAAFAYLLDHPEAGEQVEPDYTPIPAPPTNDPAEKIVFKRRDARPCDLKKLIPDPDAQYKRVWDHNGLHITYYVNKMYGEPEL